jgi:hypothetical protein
MGVHEVPRNVMRISSSASGSLIQHVSRCSKRLFCWSGAFFFTQGAFEEQVLEASIVRDTLLPVKANPPAASVCSFRYWRRESLWSFMMFS